MFLKFLNQTVFFCTNLIELIPIESNEKYYDFFRINCVDKAIFDFNNLQCPNCKNLDSLIDCKLKLFDQKLFYKYLKNSIKKPIGSNITTTQKAFSYFTQTQNSIFYTQTDSGYYLDKSNSMVAMNSILDALENIGYYGFTSFNATIQRIGFIKWNHFSQYQTQRTQTQTETNQYKRQIIVSDRQGLFALIIFPLNLDSNHLVESKKYQFNSLKFIEKQNISKKDNSEIFDQINYLWYRINSKKENNSKLSPKLCQKIIYIFEYISLDRSSLIELGDSKDYIQLENFLSLKNIRFNEAKLSEQMMVNLNDIIILKMYEHDQNSLVFFIEKLEAFTSINFKIKSVQVKSFTQFRDKSLIKILQDNFVIYKTNAGDQDCVLSLNNISLLEPFEQNKINFNIFSTIESIELVKFEKYKNQNLIYYDSNDLKSVENFIYSKLPELKNDYELIQFEFCRVKGTILTVCEENSCFDFYCPHCQKKEDNIDDHNFETFRLDFDLSQKSWICNSCGNSNKSPLLNIQIQVVLNCVGISRKFNLRLHQLTIKKLIELEKLENMFTNETNQLFDISLLIDKLVGPVSCFIYKFDDSEIYAEEIAVFRN